MVLILILDYYNQDKNFKNQINKLLQKYNDQINPDLVDIVPSDNKSSTQLEQFYKERSERYAFLFRQLRKPCYYFRLINLNQSFWFALLSTLISNESLKIFLLGILFIINISALSYVKPFEANWRNVLAVGIQAVGVLQTIVYLLIINGTTVGLKSTMNYNTAATGETTTFNSEYTDIFLNVTTSLAAFTVLIILATNKNIWYNYIEPCINKLRRRSNQHKVTPDIGTDDTTHTSDTEPEWKTDMYGDMDVVQSIPVQSTQNYNINTIVPETSPINRVAHIDRRRRTWIWKDNGNNQVAAPSNNLSDIPLNVDTTDKDEIQSHTLHNSTVDSTVIDVSKGSVISSRKLPPIEWNISTDIDNAIDSDQLHRMVNNAVRIHSTTHSIRRTSTFIACTYTNTFTTYYGTKLSICSQ